MHEACSHAGSITEVAAPRDVCEACIEIGSTWVHLRQCLTCGRTLCCNDSPNRHMTAHWNETGHPVMRGASPGEQWVWCFADDAMIRRRGDGAWETYDPFVDAGISVAKQHLEGGGSADPDEDLTRFGFPLGDWFAYVRELHGEGQLDASDATAIEALPNWHW